VTLFSCFCFLVSVCFEILEPIIRQPTKVEETKKEKPTSKLIQKRQHNDPDEVRKFIIIFPGYF
jgi:hypothetical protein